MTTERSQVKRRIAFARGDDIHLCMRVCVFARTRARVCICSRGAMISTCACACACACVCSHGAMTSTCDVCARHPATARSMHARVLQRQRSAEAFLSFFLMYTCAPPCNNSEHTRACPPKAAQCRAVSPSSERAFTSACVCVFVCLYINLYVIHIYTYTYI
jgi:hypothetical protein